MRPVTKGFWLAAANVVLIACALSFELHMRVHGIAFLIFIHAIFPAVIVGTVLGYVAGVTAAHRPWWRLAVLAIPACGLVVALANMFDMLRFVPHACIPTLAAAAILEHTTRQPQIVPRAAVQPR